MSQLVYIMADQKTDLLKVGVSVDPEFRAGQISKQFGCDAVVLGILRVEDAIKTERFIHGMLAGCRVVGEWFEVSPQQRGYLLAYFSEKPKQAPKVAQVARPRPALALPDGMIDWKLKSTMDAHGVTRYALQQKTGVAMNTIRGMYDGTTRRPDLDVMDRLIHALRDITQTPVTLYDVLEWRE